MRRLETLVVVAALAAVIFTVGVTGSSAAVSAQKTTFTGYGFDACTAPAVASMQAWTASPYRARRHLHRRREPRLRRREPDLGLGLAERRPLGLSLMPLYVGLQAPCVAPEEASR